MPTRLLAIDPGASCGYAILEVDDKTSLGTVIEYGLISFDRSSQYVGDHCISLMATVNDLIVRHSIKSVGIEDYFASSRFASGTDINYYYRGALQMQCRHRSLPYEMLNASEWKKFIASRSVPTPAQKKLYGKQAAKKIMIQQSLWERFKIRFPNHSISPKTGKPIAFRMDVVDAVGQVIYLCCRLYGISQYQSTIITPPDAELRIVSAKNFTYPDAV
jgi:Holliday junction resolvasome RuvABC endonuclease subunit